MDELSAEWAKLLNKDRFDVYSFTEYHSIVVSSPT